MEFELFQVSSLAKSLRGAMANSLLYLQRKVNLITILNDFPSLQFSLFLFPVFLFRLQFKIFKEVFVVLRVLTFL